ncbi:MAG: DUF4350 domain-containing protein [Armatimonadota bacterium]
MSRWTRPLKAAVWVVVVAVVIGVPLYIMGRHATSSSAIDQRIDDYGRSGFRAWAELLRRENFEVRKWRGRLDALSSSHQALIITSPARHFIKGEIRSLVQWVHDGGVLLIAPSRHTLRDRYRLYDEPIPPVQQLLGPFGLAEKRKTQLPGRVAVDEAVPLTRDVGQLYAPSHLRLLMVTKTELAERYPEAAESPYYDLHLSPQPQARQIVLAQMAGDPVAVMVQYGDGWVLAVSEADMFANRWITNADNAVLAANFAYLSGARTIYFDEYHKNISMLSLQGLEATASGVRQVLILALAALGLFFVGKMIRFGRPVPLQGRPRHSAREVIQALAGLYSQAGAADAAIETIARNLRRRMARSVRMPPAAFDDGDDSDDRRLAQLCAGRHEELDRDDLIALLRDLRAASERGRHISQREMLHLSQRAADVEKELDERGN